MVSLTRWQAAQTYERGYWLSQATQVREGSIPELSWYHWRARRLMEDLRELGLDHLVEGNARVIEVGSGPVGVVAYFPGSERVAVDPLADFYARRDALVGVRDPAVQYRQGVGEALPCPSAHYQLAIIENCIDHVRDVDGVMAELHRALIVGGVLYLTVNSRTRWGFGIHRLLSRLQIDAGHPYTFTVGRAQALMRRAGFRILRCQVGSYLKAFRDDMAGSGIRPRVKALLGTSEFVVSIIAQREDIV